MTKDILMKIQWEHSPKIKPKTKISYLTLMGNTVERGWSLEDKK